MELPQTQQNLMDFGEVRQRAEVNPFDEETLERIKVESFYGQTDVDLSEVRRRMKETEELVGSAEDFQRFVVNGLRSLGCVVEENNDLHQTLRITLGNSRLEGPGYESVVERATFDPKIALQSQTGGGAPRSRTAGHASRRRLDVLVFRTALKHVALLNCKYCPKIREHSNLLSVIRSSPQQAAGYSIQNKDGIVGKQDQNSIRGTRKNNATQLLIIFTAFEYQLDRG